MSEPDLNLLIALDVLLAEASVAAAARRLGLSASAMSRTLTRLRETTGDPLLVRAGRGMVLTPHAEALRQRSHDTLFDARALLRPARTEADLATLKRTFTLRANEGFIDAFAAPLIAAATAAAPHVRLRFAAKLEKSAAPLREGSADLEVGVLGEMGPEVRVQTLFRDRFLGVVRHGHPLASDAVITPERYVAFGHVVASRRHGKSGPVDEGLAALGLKRQIVAEVPSFPAALAVARASDLVALVPETFMSHLTEEQPPSYNAPYAFELPVPTEKITVSQMWHPRVEHDPIHRWLRQLVLTVCRQRVSPG